METHAVGDRQHLVYRFSGHDDEAPFVIEQQVYFTERDGSHRLDADDVLGVQAAVNCRSGVTRRGPGGVLMPNRQTDKEDTMALRVPKAELATGLSETMIEQFGAVPEPSR